MFIDHNYSYYLADFCNYLNSYNYYKTLIFIAIVQYFNLVRR